MGDINPSTSHAFQSEVSVLLSLFCDEYYFAKFDLSRHQPPPVLLSMHRRTVASVHLALAFYATVYIMLPFATESKYVSRMYKRAASNQLNMRSVHLNAWFYDFNQ